MDGEGGDPEYRAVYLDQLCIEPAVLVGDDYTSSQRQVAIQPRVPDAAAVRLHADLKVAGLGALGNRSHLYSRTVIGRESCLRKLQERGMLTLKLGLSTCVATMDTPAPCFHFAGMVNATNELWFLGAC